MVDYRPYEDHESFDLDEVPTPITADMVIGMHQDTDGPYTLAEAIEWGIAALEDGQKTATAIELLKQALWAVKNPTPSKSL